MTALHRTRDGQTIKIEEMDDNHLANTIALHHRLAKSGVTLRAGGGGTAEEMWYDEWTVFGDEALSALHTAEYEAEAKRRKEEK